MTHSQGYRCKTRHVFKRAHREHGRANLTTYQTVYHRGDRVQILVNGSIHKGMPHRYYHGKTGIVFNINPRAIGVEVDKRVGNRIMKKRIHVRVEHLKISTSGDAHHARVVESDKQKQAVKAGTAKFVDLKRKVAAPAASFVITAPKVVDIAPVPFAGIYV
ncbi:Ribosomal_protein L21 [Hexamita inflata]|uniref:Ribosomal protein L21 n=1 Tax=Hexamita inflata TaxID=28002 RepID=A0AA86RKA5_9EUKA|nr:Ribosomal protein L21 [Hexamita inflata]CAI9969486.1 Ribosomal protein L21 [Hexamita inflata]CAI9976146.1 Ribosomal protein L21 [Hexamita inflata]